MATYVYKDALKAVLPQFVPRMAHKWDSIGIQLAPAERVSQLQNSPEPNEKKMQDILDAWIESADGRYINTRPLLNSLRSSDIGLHDVAKDLDEAATEEDRRRIAEQHRSFEEAYKRIKEEARQKWQSAYQESLRKHGSVSVEVTPSIFIGPPESGKSTLKHLLVHNTPKAVKTSTAMMDTPEVVTKRPTPKVVTKQTDEDFLAERYVVGESTSAWQLVDSDIMRKALHTSIANRAYDEKDQYPAGVEAKGTGDGQRKAAMERKMDSSPLLSQLEARKDQSDIALLDQQYSQLLETMGKEGKHFELKNAFFIHLLDTGGQPSFQDVLPLLLEVPCTYVQVFNAALGLNERVPISYRSDDHTRVCLEEGAELGRDIMLRSFSSMQTMAHKCSKELASFLQTNSPPPQLRIFVVGTHKDEIKKDRLDKATKDIANFMKGLNGKPYYRSIKWDSSAGQPFFLVNAMADKDDRASVNHLRECLSSEGSPLKLDVPVMWFICQEITHHTRKKFFRLLDLEVFCQKHRFVDGEDAASQFRALLQLFSLLGFYSFFNLEGVLDKDNFVCTNRGVFLKEVSKLLAVQFIAPKSPDVDTFRKTGILVFTPEIFQDLEMSQEMDPHWFLRALQHLGIAARLPCKDRLEYFIPAALPQKAANTDPLTSVAPLCFTYEIKEGAVSSYSDMPRGVFCRLAVELIRQEWEILKHENSRSLLRFRCGEHEEYDILLQECPGYISVIPQAVYEVPSPSELHTACRSLVSTVKQCLSASAKDVLGNQFSSHTQLAMGFRCHCKEDIVPHLATPSKQGKFLLCTQSARRQKFSNRQSIWFSPVTQVEIKHYSDEGIGIWVLEDSVDSVCLSARHDEVTTQPQPTPRPPQPTPQPPQPTPQPPQPTPQPPQATPQPPQPTPQPPQPTPQPPQPTPQPPQPTPDEVSLQSSSVTRTGTLQTGKRQKRVHAQQNPASCSKKRAMSPQKAADSPQSDDAILSQKEYATLVQVIQDDADKFLKEMNSTVLAHRLKALGLIPAIVETNVLQSKSREDANAHLLQHLKDDADMKSVMEIFRIASQEPGYGRMNKFADSVLRKLQQGL